MQNIAEHMEVIGADGVHIGTVDKVEGNQVCLSATGASALLFEEEEDGGALADKNPD